MDRLETLSLLQKVPSANGVEAQGYRVAQVASGPHRRAGVAG